MNNLRTLPALVIAAVLFFVSPSALCAAEPETLPQKTFDVQIERGAAPTVEVTFALALGDVPTYAVGIVAISGQVEELLYEGTLSEGFYRLRAPLAKITSGPLKIVLRARITHRTAAGPQNFTRYATWEGSL